jgi:hypothetical protein
VAGSVLKVDTFGCRIRLYLGLTRVGEEVIGVEGSSQMYTFHEWCTTAASDQSCFLPNFRNRLSVRLVPLHCLLSSRFRAGVGVGMLGLGCWDVGMLG